jgi:NADH-quinone oxidoreductase subunit M
MVYDRTHTRDLEALGNLNLAQALPFAAVTFVIASFASMGLPGFSGFIAEIAVLIGTWASLPTAAVVAGLGILVGVAYLLRTLQSAFFAERPEPAVAHAGSPLEPISVPERMGAAMLIGVSLLVGLYPRILLDLIVPSVLPIIEGLRKGGAL